MSNESIGPIKSVNHFHLQIPREKQTAPHEQNYSPREKQTAPHEQMELLQDPCIKKLRMLSAQGTKGMCDFLDVMATRVTEAKMDMIATEDREQLLAQSFIEKEASVLTEIRQLEELVVTFAGEKKSKKIITHWDHEFKY